MSRTFNGSDQYLQAEIAFCSGYPCSYSAWIKPTNLTTVGYVVNIADKSVTNHQLGLLVNYQTDGCIKAVGYSGSFNTAIASTNMTVGVWNHAAATFTNSTLRAAYHNGGSKGIATTSITPTGLDRTCIGRAGDSTPGIYLLGEIAEVGIWDIALSDADVAMLGKGFSPLSVKPINLVAYFPLLRDR